MKGEVVGAERLGTDHQGPFELDEILEHFFFLNMIPKDAHV
jgi:hypothetical protein